MSGRPNTASFEETMMQLDDHPQTTRRVKFSDLQQQQQQYAENRKQTIETSVTRLHARLAPLVSKPYYKDHLDVGSDNLTRWLESTDGNALLAEARLRCSIAARRNAKKQAPSERECALEDHLGGGMCGVDRQGSPVYFLLFGHTDMLGISQSCTRDQAVKFWLDHFDAMIKQLKRRRLETDQDIHNILLIIDMQKCGLNNFRWPVLRAWAQVLQLYDDIIPGLIKEVVVINPPPTLPFLHSFFSRRLSRHLRERISILVNSQVLRFLLLRMEKHEIPAYLGGYKCDVDNNPYCRNDILWPQEVCRWQYLSDKRLPIDVIKMVVEAGGEGKHDLEIPAAGTQVLWEISDLTHPVTLKIIPPPAPANQKTSCCYTPTKSRPPYIKSLTDHTKSHGGALVAQVPGIYTLVLDNRKDLIHVLRTSITVDIIPPVGFFLKYDRKFPLGDSIDFQRPVTEEERANRRRLILAAHDGGTRLDQYY